MDTLKQSTLKRVFNKICQLHKYENSTTILFDTFFLDEIAEFTVEKYAPFSLANVHFELTTRSKMNTNVFSAVFTSESHKIELRIFNPKLVGIHQDFSYKNVHYDDV